MTRYIVFSIPDIKSYADENDARMEAEQNCREKKESYAVAKVIATCTPMPFWDELTSDENRLMGQNQTLCTCGHIARKHCIPGMDTRCDSCKCPRFEADLKLT